MSSFRCFEKINRYRKLKIDITVIFHWYIFNCVRFTIVLNVTTNLVISKEHTVYFNILEHSDDMYLSLIVIAKRICQEESKLSVKFLTQKRNILYIRTVIHSSSNTIAYKSYIATITDWSNVNTVYLIRWN